MQKMAVSRLAACFILLSILSFYSVFSQNSLSPESIVIGYSYKFVLYDDTEIIGKVTGRDSNNIYVSVPSGAYKLKKEDIFSISRSLLSDKFSVVFSLGGGFSFHSRDENHDYPYEDFKDKYSMQLSALIPLKENNGIRIDAGYTKQLRDEKVFPTYGGNGYSKIGSQTNELYCLKADYVFGFIKPSYKFWVYGTVGFGMNLLKKGQYTDSYSYYSSYDSSYHSGSYSNVESNLISPMISGGASFGYRFTNRLGVYADIQLNVYGLYFIFPANTGTYIPVRAGLTYTIF